MYDTAAENMGKVFISTELRWWRINNCLHSRDSQKRHSGTFLKHAGITKGDLEVDRDTQSRYAR